MKKILIIIGLIILLVGIGYIKVQKDNKKAIVESDVKKVATFATLRLVTELYFEKYQKYPKAEGNTPEARWNSLNNALAKEGTSVSVIQDEKQQGKGFSYDYQTSPNQDQAVLKATLEAPDDIYVKMAVDGGHSLHGVFWGVDCNGSQYYCVSPVHRN